MCTADAVLAEHGIPLATNQVQINLLKRDFEHNGVLETARRLGVTLIAYSPLRSGMLTGKLHDNHNLVLVAAMPRFRRTVNGITEKISTGLNRSSTPCAISLRHTKRQLARSRWRG